MTRLVPTFCMMVIFLCLSHGWLCAQSQTTWLIGFKDKGTNGLNDIKLSSRSLERRHRQGIKLSQKDVPVCSEYLQFLTEKGGFDIKSSRWMNGVVSSFFQKSEDVELMLSNLHFVQYSIEMKNLSRPSGVSGFDDPPVNNLKRTKEKISGDYGYAKDQVEMLNMHLLHTLGYKGEGMVIAVLDAGFSGVDTLVPFSHLYTNSKLLDTYNFVNGTSSVYHTNSHGTRVLSTMSASLDGVIKGTAPLAQYALYVSEDVYSETLEEEFNWLLAAERADSIGADVINSSLGYSTFDDPSENHSYSDMNGNTAVVTKAADWAAEVGILVVTSAGNYGGSSWQYISAPADADSVLSVGAVDLNKDYASFSSTGPTSDGRIKPDVCAIGQGSAVFTVQGSVQYQNGTSFSSPIIAGSVASLWGANYSANNMKVIDVVRSSSDQFENPDSLKGYGIPDFMKAYELLTGEDPWAILPDTAIVYPNPYYSEINLDLYSDQFGEYNLEVYNLNGQLVWEANMEHPEYYTLNTVYPQVSNANGVYVLVVKSSNEEFRKVFKLVRVSE